jgi:hypothetical protein
MRFLNIKKQRNLKRNIKRGLLLKGKMPNLNDFTVYLELGDMAS